MSERAHPEDPGFQNKWFGFKKNIYRQNMFKRYALCNQYIRDKIVLDIPCGVGWGTSTLKKAKHIYGIDIDPCAIEYAVNHYSNSRLEFCVGSMENIPFDNKTFDVVICLEGFEHISKDSGVRFINEAKRVVKQNGIIIITTPIITNGKHSGNPYHIFEPTLEEFDLIVKSSFSVVCYDLFDGPDSKNVIFVGSNIA